MKKVIKSDNLKPPLPVLSPGILWKDFVFVLGMAGLDKNRKPISKDISKQTIRTMERIEEVLKAENLSFKNVVKTRLFLTNATDFEIVNKTYKEITGEDFPANSFAQIIRCPILGEDVKIQMIAYKGEKRLVKTDRAPTLTPDCPQAIAVEDFLFIQGMNGIDVNTGRLAGDEIIGQTEKTFENIYEVLKAANLSFENIVKTTTFVTNLDEIGKLEPVYRKYFNFLSPCFIEIPRISSIGEKIMIEAVASKKVGKRLVVKDVPSLFSGMAQGISTGDLIFVQGMGGIDAATGKVVSEDIVKQTERALKNIEKVLEQDGMTLNNAVDASIFVIDMDQYSWMNEIYGKHMGDQPPARICVEVSRMPWQCGIMIEIVAAQ